MCLSGKSKIKSVSQKTYRIQFHVFYILITPWIGRNCHTFVVSALAGYACTANQFIKINNYEIKRLLLTRYYYSNASWLAAFIKLSVV